MSDNLSPEEMRNLNEAMRSLNDDFRNLSSSTKNFGKDAETEQKKSQMERKKQLDEAFKQMGAGVKSLHNSTTELSGGQTKYASGIASTTDALGTMVGMIGGPLAKSIGALIKGIGLVTEGVLKQNDKVLESYDILGKFGGASGVTTDKLIRLGLDAQFTSHNLNKFADAAMSVAPQLVALGGSVGGGMKAFAEIASVTDDQLAMYRRLGVSQEDLLKHQASYMKYQTDSGRTLTKDTAKLREQTLAYTNNLLDLAAITGKDVDAQKEHQAAMANDERFVAAQRQAELSGNETRIKEAARIKDLYEMLGPLMGKDKAAAIASFATSGIADGDTISKMSVMMGSDLPKLIKGVKEGTVSRDEFTKSYFDKADKTLGRIGMLSQVSGGLSTFGIGLDEMKNRQQVAGSKSEKEIAAERELKARTPGADTRLETDNKRQQMERSSRKAEDEFYLLMSKGVNPALGKLADVTEKLYGASGKVLKFFNKLVGEEGVEPEAAAPAATNKKGSAPGRSKGPTTAPPAAPTTTPTTAPPTAPAPTAPAATAPAPTASGKNMGSAPGRGAVAKTSASAKTAEAPATVASSIQDAMKLISFGSNSGDRSHFDNLDSSVKESFLSMIASYGKPVNINSALRTEEEQQALYDKWIDGGKQGNPVAPPGKSKHGEGRALDLNGTQVADLDKQGLLAQYGFSRIPNDPPHIQMADGGVINASPGGTLVQAGEAGKNEAFVPLPKGRSIPVNIPGMEKLSQDLKLLVGDDNNNPLVKAISNKLDPEKLAMSVLTKNIPGLSKLMTLNSASNIAGSEEMSSTQKILEIAKMLNPTVRLVSKLYDTYQALAGDDSSPFGNMVNTMADNFKTKSNTDAPDVNGLIKAQVEQQQQSQQQLVAQLSTAMTTATAPPTTDNSTQMAELLADKLNTMIDKLDASNDTQTKILQEARA